MRGRGLVLAATVLLPQGAAAQGWIERGGPDAGRGRSPVVRTGSEVRIVIAGRVARFEIEERFRNDGPGVAEGSYLYPLPAEAAFTGFSLFFGDQELQGEVLPAEQARDIYERIVRTQRDPALLTLAGHGLIRARVFPIQPRETRKVILRYTQILAADAGAFRLRYPLGSRGDGPITVTVVAEDTERFGVPYSPTHGLERRFRNGRVEVCVEARPQGTLDLLLPVRKGLVGASLLTHAAGRDERLFMLVVSPPVSGRRDILPRDLTLVVDVSGSMAGAKMEQARRALQQALAGLRPADRFRIIAFASRITEFRDGLAPATPAALREARRFVEELQPGGGTNIAGALDQVLERPATRGRLGLAVFLTDGVPTVGEQNPEKIAARAAGAGSGQRIFPIGLGHDVNTYLLDRLALEARGRVEYVAPEADVEMAVGTVLTRLDAPALTDLRIVSSPVRLLEMAPADLPDLFHGEELVIFGRYEGTGRGAVVIEGQRNGRRERFTAQAVFAAREPDNSFIAPLWASRRIGELTRQLRLEGHSPALVRQIRDLGLRYGIITEYTSYLVLEPGMRLPVTRDDADRNLASPSAQVGEEAFRRAERSAKLRDAVRLDEVVVTERDGTGADRRQVAGKLFVRRGDVWTDVAHADTVQTVEIAAFSPAWFALARALPEVSAWLNLGDEVVIAGRRVSLRLGRAGATAWRPGELERVVREFRGS